MAKTTEPIMGPRVRFAPSPTGYLHIGGLRTALYNYLFARRAGGRFVLRIEDTDRARFVADAEADILASLAWAGISIDEGPVGGGPYGPYRQSERSELYLRHTERLLESGRAYRAFDTPEELEALRAGGGRYDASTRESLRNGLSLSTTVCERLVRSGTPWVARLRVEPGREIAFDDAIRGRVVFGTGAIDDQVLMKSDGLPTYHLANVVDDHHMEITHVIRGEEWLPSVPKHLLLYEAFGWDPPVMAHLPLILSPAGGKLSKRSADLSGTPVLVKDYPAAGYEPEAVVNYLAFLGWNPGDGREVFTLQELVEAFSLERVGSAGVQFDAAKLEWFNRQHVMALGSAEIARRMRPLLEAAGLDADDGYLERVARLLRERLPFLRDVSSEAGYFFADPDSYEEEGARRRWTPDSPLLVAAYADRIADLATWGADEAESTLRDLAEERGVGAGRLIHPVRLAVTGRSAGPGLFEVLEILGRDTCVRRLRRAAAVIGS